MKLPTMIVYYLWVTSPFLKIGIDLMNKWV